jgi:alpha/beta superfamily hydrolase
MVKIPVAEFALEAEAQLLPGAPGAVVCHPHPAFGGRMDTPLVLDLAEALGAAGLSTVRFNFRGLDGSGGTATGGLREHEDVIAVATWLRAAGAPRVALVGYSFGSLMAARALAEGCDAFAFVAVGLPTTIIGEDRERVGHVEAALARGVPSLFIAGDEDQFCEIERIAGWIAGSAWARQEIMRGYGHFFADEQSRQVCTRVAEFVRQC